ncbi:MAG: HupE/UreJ family protein, partial [Akkermansiaceae bacterium]|nr:HupE/UreJ family protein [Verrucomicrobiales bacterium]
MLLSRVNASVEISLPPLPVLETGAPVITSGTNLFQPAGSVESPATSRPTIPRPAFLEFLKLGIEHILIGFDHLLFLCALLIGVRQIKPMLWIITCFTLAHSVTLALSALNIVMLSSRLVEPLIALSIIVVAVENIFRKEATTDRYWMAGGFGLIHGFGFASVLRDTGL